MKTTPKTKQAPKEGKRPPETIEERVHRHISDINSKITDDDIKSVRTELDIRKSAPLTEDENDASPKQKRNSRRGKKGDTNGLGKKTTP